MSIAHENKLILGDSQTTANAICRKMVDLRRFWERNLIGEAGFVARAGGNIPRKAGERARKPGFNHQEIRYSQITKVARVNQVLYDYGR